MSSLTQQTDHVGDGVDRLLEQFKDRPRIVALLTAYLNQVQDLEDVLWELFLDRWISTAVGEQLNVIGRVVGEKRQGSLDDEYRAFLRARIRANRSVGLLAELVKIVALIQDDNLQVLAREYDPAAVRLEPTGATIVDARRVARILADAKPSGVALRYVYSETARTGVLLGGDAGGGFTPTADQSPGDYQSSPVGGGVLASVSE